MDNTETCESPVDNSAERLAAALKSNLTKTSPNLTNEELAVFDADAQVPPVSRDVMDTIADELAKYVKPEDPATAKAFLRSFAMWIDRQRKTGGAKLSTP